MANYIPSRRNFLKQLGGAFGAGLLGLSGCDDYESKEKARKDWIIQKRREKQKFYDDAFSKSDESIAGVVLEEKLGMVMIPNEGQKTAAENRYTVKVQSGDKIIAVNVLDDGDITKEGLELLIEPGMTISFPKGDMVRIEKNKYGGLESLETYGYECLRHETDLTRIPVDQKFVLCSKYASRINVLNGNPGKLPVKAEKE